MPRIHLCHDHGPILRRCLGDCWVYPAIRNLSNDNHSRFHVERLRQLKWFPVEENAGRFLIQTCLVWTEDLNPRDGFTNTKSNIVCTPPQRVD